MPAILGSDQRVVTRRLEGQLRHSQDNPRKDVDDNLLADGVLVPTKDIPAAQQARDERVRGLFSTPAGFQGQQSGFVDQGENGQVPRVLLCRLEDEFALFAEAA